MAYLTKRYGGIFYICYQTSTGEEKRTSLKTRDRKLAEKIEEDYNAAERMQALGLPVLQKQGIKNPTMNELFERYVGSKFEKYDPGKAPWWKDNTSPRTYRDTEMHVRLTLRPSLGNVRALDLAMAGPGKNELSPLDQMIAQMRTHVDTETGKPDPFDPRTINLRLETLRKIFKKAVNDGVLPTGTPCPVKLVKQPKRLGHKYAVPSDLAQWFAGFDEDSWEQKLRAILSYHTGISDKDMSHIRIPQGFDRQNRMLRFMRPKSSREWVIPLNAIAMRVMRLLVKDNPGPRLFRSQSSKRAFRTASKNSKIKITPHMLRHSFATAARSQGASLDHIGDILGHEDPSTTKIYAKIMPMYLRDTVKKMEKSGKKGIDWTALLKKPRGQKKRKG